MSRDLSKMILLYLIYHPKNLSYKKLHNIFISTCKDTFKDLLDTDNLIITYYALDNLRKLVALSNTKECNGIINKVSYYTKTKSLKNLNTSIDIKTYSEDIMQKEYIAQ